VRDADELLKLPDLGGTRVGGGTTTAEVSFLRALALEQLGKTEEAISAYLAIQDGRNEYYGERSTQRLFALSGNERTRNAVANRFQSFATAAKTANASGNFDEARVAAQNAIRLTQDQNARKELIEILRRSYNALPKYKLPSFQLLSLANDSATKDPSQPSHQQLAEQLFVLGLYDEAIPELLAARSSTSTSLPATNQQVTFASDGYSLATYALRGGLANRAVRFAESLWKTMPADYVLEAAPRDLVELLYPVPFRDSLLKHAPARNVDPRFVLSIIRQESRYQLM
jgi:tetratricopeptide (TPR) repeat protein